MQAVLGVVTLLLFGLAVAASAAFARPLAVRLGVLDMPDGGRKRHQVPTPLVGGVALMAPLGLVAAGSALWAPAFAPILAVAALANLGFLVLGFLDDRRHVAPKVRLLVSLALILVFVAIEPDLVVRTIDAPSLGWTVALGALAVPFAVVCLIGLLNAVNMADGKNGLVIGLASSWVAMLLAYAPDGLVPYLACFLLGLLILLPFNLAGRLFLGDAGSYSIGVTVGVLAMYVHGQNARLPAVLVMLWLLVPVLDCLRLIATRMIEGRSPFSGDRNHLHHRLMLWFPWPASLAVYLALAIGPAVLGCLVPDAAPALVLLSAGLYLVVIRLTRPVSEPARKLLA